MNRNRILKLLAAAMAQLRTSQIRSVKEKNDRVIAVDECGQTHRLLLPESLQGHKWASAINDEYVVRSLWSIEPGRQSTFLFDKFNKKSGSEVTFYSSFKSRTPHNVFSLTGLKWVTGKIVKRESVIEKDELKILVVIEVVNSPEMIDPNHCESA